MTDPEWTPGPWQIAKNKWNAKPHEPWTDAIKIEGDVSFNWSVPPLVCVTYRGDGADANAHLIAAAPDLYAALLAAEEELRLIRMKDTAAVYNPVLRTQMTLALAKARGENNDAKCA